jgi:hypothetical protein
VALQQESQKRQAVLEAAADAKPYYNTGLQANMPTKAQELGQGGRNLGQAGVNITFKILNGMQYAQYGDPEQAMWDGLTPEEYRPKIVEIPTPQLPMVAHQYGGQNPYTTERSVGAGEIAITILVPEIAGRAVPFVAGSRIVKGAFGQDVEVVSDFFTSGEIVKTADAPKFYAVPTQNGGRLWVSVKKIAQPDFAKLVQPGGGANIQILTGTHGNLNGLFGGTLTESQFLAEDLGAFGGQSGVTVIDVTKLTPAQVAQAVNSSDHVICAWCYSERAKTVVNAVKAAKGAP